jgi:hypothetical protein
MSEFRKANPSEYIWLSSKGLLEQLSKDMGWKYIAKNKKYDLTEIIEMSKKYNSYSEWRKNEQVIYRLATKHKLTNKICEVNNWSKRLPNNYWTKERCIEEAKKYKTYKEWTENSSGSVSAAFDNNCIKECMNHMILFRKHNNYWTKELCIEEAKKYKTRKDWRHNNKASWTAAQRLKIYEECTKHMSIIKTWKRTK